MGVLQESGEMGPLGRGVSRHLIVYSVSLIVIIDVE